jgi:hypothetical protein
MISIIYHKNRGGNRVMNNLGYVAAKEKQRSKRSSVWPSHTSQLKECSRGNEITYDFRYVLYPQIEDIGL